MILRFDLASTLHNDLLLIKQQLDAPPLFVKKRNLLGRYLEVIGQKLVLPVLFILVANPSQSDNRLGTIHSLAFFVFEHVFQIDKFLSRDHWLVSFRFAFPDSLYDRVNRI